MAANHLVDQSWRKDKRKTSERGYGYRWQKARKQYLEHNPLCVICKREKRVTLATVVDHKIKHEGNSELFWDESNWQSLCAPHHNSDKQSEERSGRVTHMIGDDGYPINILYETVGG